MPGAVPSEKTVAGYFERYNNWGRWGKEDQLGTINFITPAKRRNAAALVREGVTVTCARPLAKELVSDVLNPVQHYMVGSGEQFAGKEQRPGELQSCSDFFGLVFHDPNVTHVDAPGHVFFNGKLYNGFPAEKITAREGATVESIDVLKDGIVSRGVLLDIPRLSGRPYLDIDEAVFPEDLERAEKEYGVKVESGDLLLIRTGLFGRRMKEGTPLAAGRPGPHAACIPWFHERQIAMLGGDSGNEVRPHPYEKVLRMPVHQVGLPGMGLWLLDYGNLEALAESCERFKRWEFLLTIGPLRIVHGTGSPVNPIAVF